MTKDVINNLTPGAKRLVVFLQQGARLHAIDHGRQGRDVTCRFLDFSTTKIKWDIFTQVRAAGLLKMTGGGKQDGHYVLADGI